MQQGTPYSSLAQSEAWHWKSEYLGRTFRSPFGGLHLNLECKELTLLPSPTSCPPTTCSSFTFLSSLSYADWRHWRCNIWTYSMQCTINRLSQQVSTLLYLQCYILGSHGRLWCQPDQSARMCLTDWSAEWERSLTVSQTGTLCAGQDRQSSSGQHQHTTPPGDAMPGITHLPLTSPNGVAESVIFPIIKLDTSHHSAIPTRSMWRM